MNIILLSGGSGTRLWPLSNEVRSKQFIRIFQTETGSHESMLQRICRQVTELDGEASITIATSKAQASAIHSQLGDGVSVCVEPCRRDTFGAITLAAAYLHDIKKIPLQETAVVCPVDPYVERDYFEALIELDGIAKRGDASLVLMGVKPSYPSEKYGYIIPESQNRVSRVMEFKEKPNAADAGRYIAQGALWNGGVFAFRLGYALERAREHIAFTDYQDLYSKYGTLEKTSFDYAVVEREKDIQVMRFTGSWRDIGTWNTLAEAMGEETVGNVVTDGTGRNVHIVNELDIPILCMGLENAVVCAGPDGILAADKERSGFIKPLVERLDRKVMYAEKSWGTYRVLDVEHKSLTIKVTLNAGERMNYHSHDRRDEVWVVISGDGMAIVDGVEKHVCTGDVVKMHAGCRHTIIAETELKMVEVQLGEEISIHDKDKYELKR